MIINLFEILNFGHCDLFVVWDLEFGISYSTPMSMVNYNNLRE
jgi:hypothetical protein